MSPDHPSITATSSQSALDRSRLRPRARVHGLAGNPRHSGYEG